jgi:hypothetical protein
MLSGTFLDIMLDATSPRRILQIHREIMYFKFFVSAVHTENLYMDTYRINTIVVGINDILICFFANMHTCKYQSVI